MVFPEPWYREKEQDGGLRWFSFARRGKDTGVGHEVGGAGRAEEQADQKDRPLNLRIRTHYWTLPNISNGGSKKQAGACLGATLVSTCPSSPYTRLHSSCWGA